MFSHIISDVSDLEPSTYNLDELSELVKQTDQLHLEYEGEYNFICKAYLLLFF